MLKKKHAFYPTEEVERVLAELDKGKLSQRVNDLILKGLSFEQEKNIELAYQKYDLALASQACETSAKFMSKGAFESEDEVEDFI